MQINKTTGLLIDCAQCPSPNKDTRPEKTPINLIVVHSISLPPGEYGGDAIENFFQNKLETPPRHMMPTLDGNLVSFNASPEK